MAFIFYLFMLFINVFFLNGMKRNMRNILKKKKTKIKKKKKINKNYLL